jgi:hypothetical protein
LLLSFFLFDYDFFLSKHLSHHAQLKPLYLPPSSHIQRDKACFSPEQNQGHEKIGLEQPDERRSFSPYNN